MLGAPKGSSEVSGRMLGLKFAEGVEQNVCSAFELALAARAAGRPGDLSVSAVLEIATGSIQGYVAAIAKHLGRDCAAIILQQIALDNGLDLVRRQK